MEDSRLIIFDIDGTMLPGTSCERLFFQYLLENRILTFRNMINFAIRGVMLAPRGRSYSIKANKGYMRGMSMSRLREVGRIFFDEVVAHRISKKGIEALEYHRGNGQRIMLLSGMPEFLLENFARYLDVREFRGSLLEVNSDRITGLTKGIFPLSEGKARIVESIIGELEIRWDDVTAYADHFGDRFLLSKVGHPVAVNPDYNLRKIAMEKGWPIVIFD